MQLKFVAATLLLCSSGLLHAGTLYGLQDADFSTSPFGAGKLYTIDKSTGAATFVANVSPGDPSLVGLEYADGKLWATDTLNAGGTFGTIDSTNGNYTPVSEFSINIYGLAFIPQSNLFYTVDFDNNQQLTSITPAGVPTVIGPSAALSGLAYGNGVLYGAGDGALYSVNTATGEATAIGQLGISGNDYGLAFDTDDNTLYLNTGAGSLYSVNTMTGVASLIGSNGVTGINGLAAVPTSGVPEPGTLAVAGFGMAAIAIRRLYRRSA